MKKLELSKGMFAIVDDEDFEYLNQFKWSTIGNRGIFYACRRVGSRRWNKKILMHRDLCGQKDPTIIVDHIDGNGLNNQRLNLRVATHSQNMANRIKKKGASLYLGVSWDSQYSKWRVAIKKNGIIKRLGRFDNEVEAAKAYNIAAIEIHGEFAKLNVVA